MVWRGVSTYIYEAKEKVMADEPNSLQADEFDFDDFELDDVITDPSHTHLVAWIQTQWERSFGQVLVPVQVSAVKKANWNMYLSAIGSTKSLGEEHTTQAQCIQLIESIYLRNMFTDISLFLAALTRTDGNPLWSVNQTTHIFESFYKVKGKAKITALGRHKGKGFEDMDDNDQLKCFEVPRQLWWNKIAPYMINDMQTNKAGLPAIIEEVRLVKTQGPSQDNVYKALKKAVEKLAKGKSRDPKDMFEELVRVPGQAEFTFKELQERGSARKGSPLYAPDRVSEWPAIKALLRIVVNWRLRLQEKQRKETLETLDRIPDRCYPLTKDFSAQLATNPRAARMAQHMLLVTSDASKHAEIVQKAVEHFPPPPVVAATRTPTKSKGKKKGKARASSKSSRAPQKRNRSPEQAASTSPVATAHLQPPSTRPADTADVASRMTAARRDSERRAYNSFASTSTQPKRPSAQLQMGDREIVVIPPVPFLPDLDKIMEDPSDLAERLQYLLNKRAQHINEDLLQGRYEVSCNRLHELIQDVTDDFLPAVHDPKVATYVEQLIKLMLCVARTAVACEMKHRINATRASLDKDALLVKRDLMSLEEAMSVMAEQTDPDKIAQLQADAGMTVEASRKLRQKQRAIETMQAKVDRNVEEAKKIMKDALADHAAQALATNSALQNVTEDTEFLIALNEQERVLAWRQSTLDAKDDSYESMNARRRQTWATAVIEMTEENYDEAGELLEQAKKIYDQYEEQELQFVDAMGGLKDESISIFRFREKQTIGLSLDEPSSSEDSGEDSADDQIFSAPESFSEEVDNLIPQLAHKLVF